MSKCRDYCLTWNNYPIDGVEQCQKFFESAQYYVIGKEVGESGTPHLQMYVYFKNAVSFDSLQKKLNKCHIERKCPKSTPKRASDYCKKGEQTKAEWHALHETGPNFGKNADFIEEGELPEQGRRTDVEVVREEIKTGGGMRGVIKVATNLQQIKLAEYILKYEEPKRDWKPIVHWYWGLTGTGKSRGAHTYFEGKDFFRKTANTGKWFEGYDAHSFVIIDDMDDKSYPYKNLLDLLDMYACTVETKGGSRQFLAREIIITASEHPQSLFQFEDQGGNELLRRIDDIVQFKK